ncbi:MAG: hypothetical protein Q8907_01400 [Bacteroidota bacterium]|nr:hypothetical protein [Bacteroidota bacterium]MDP4272914.1 hypothetical protein [Bacteroidota bacterium]
MTKMGGNRTWKISFGTFLNGEIEFFANPAGVIEIALNKDLDQRQNMANAMNIVIRGQRMIVLKEYYKIDDFYVWS